MTPDRIATARRSARLTQAQFAQLLGVDKATVSRWETGAAVPRDGAMAKIEALAARQDAPKHAGDVLAEQAAADRGESHVLAAVDVAVGLGLDELTAYLLVPSAMRAHAAGVGAGAWIASKQHLPEAQIESAVAAMMAHGLWPWATTETDD